MEVEDQIFSIFSGTNGFLDDLPVESVRRFETELLQFIHEKYPELPERIRQTKDLTSDDTDTLRKAITAFKTTFKP